MKEFFDLIKSINVSRQTIQDYYEENHKNIDLNQGDPKFGNRTPLMVASLRGDLALVNFLIYKGANALATDQYDGTAIHYAAAGGNIDIMRLLISHGLSVHSVIPTGPAKGCTTIMAAAKNGHEQMVVFLMLLGCDPLAVTMKNESALSLTKSDDVKKAINQFVEKKTPMSPVNRTVMAQVQANNVDMTTPDHPKKSRTEAQEHVLRFTSNPAISKSPKAKGYELKEMNAVELLSTMEKIKRL